MPKRTEAREVVYDSVTVKVLKGKDALTSDQAKELLGWEEESGTIKFGEYLIKDSNGNKVRCHQNINNRPIDFSNILKLKQEILRRRWFLNMENRIIGETGLVLNGQHTLVALILAVQDWYNNPDRYPEWKTEPTIETSIAFGVCENDDVVNTLDTGRPRSFADVIFRSEYFADLPASARNKAAKATEHAIKLLWQRTGVPDAYAIRQTHSELLDFLDRHPKVLECVIHIIEENTKGDISKYITPGYAAGFLYLMGCSSSDTKRYQAADDPSEDDLDFELWDAACDFFVELPTFQPLLNALGKIIDEEGNRAERCALLVKAWQCVESGNPVTGKKLILKYQTDEDGIRHLVECPTVGGIDVGDEGLPDQPDPEPKPKRKKSTKKSNKPNWVADEEGGFTKE